MARPLYGDPFYYVPQFKLVLTCNVLPHIPSSDQGTWRRLRVSPWESEFVDEPKYPNQFKRDYNLLEKMTRWKEIFLWYLEKKWYPLYREKGLKEPEKEEVIEYGIKFRPISK